MKITLTLPDELNPESLGDPSRIALEALAARAYEEGMLSEKQVATHARTGILLGRPEGALHNHRVWSGTTVEDALSNMETVKNMRTARA